MPGQQGCRPPGTEFCLALCSACISARIFSLNTPLADQLRQRLGASDLCALLPVARQGLLLLTIKLHACEH